MENPYQSPREIEKPEDPLITELKALMVRKWWDGFSWGWIAYPATVLIAIFLSNLIKYLWNLYV